MCVYVLDMDGLGSRKHGGQMLTVFQDASKLGSSDITSSPQINTPAEDAGSHGYHLYTIF